MNTFYKKMASAVTLGAIVVTMLPLTSVNAATSFTDVKSTDPGYSAIMKLSQENIVSGYGNGTFKPDGTLSKVEALKMILNLTSTENIKTNQDLLQDATSFSDVGANTWYTPYVNFAINNDILDDNLTNDTSFGRDDKITRAEFIQLFVKAFKVDLASQDEAIKNTKFSDIKYNSKYQWAAPAAYAMEKYLKYVNGYTSTSFGPSNTITRREVAFIISRYLTKPENFKLVTLLDSSVDSIDSSVLTKISDDTSTPTDNTGSGSTGSGTTTGSGSTGSGVVTGTPSLTVSLSGSTTSQLIPKNASSVKVGSVKLVAGSKDVVIKTISVTRSGLGDAKGITSGQGIRASQNGVVISTSSDYYSSSSQKGTIYFYPSLVIKAGTSSNIDILASFSGTENSQHTFTVDSITSDTTPTTGLPLVLGSVSTTSYTTSIVTVGGSSNYQVTPGKTQQPIAQVDLTAGDRDVLINGFTVTRSTGSDFTKRYSNVKVYKNDTVVGTGSVSITSDKIVVSGLAMPLAAGTFQSFVLKSDILIDGSSSSPTQNFKIDSSTDVSATEVTTGYATETVGYGDFLDQVTFNNVDLTYVKLSTSDQTVSQGVSNVNLFNGKLTSTLPLTVKQLKITPAAGSLSGALAFANNKLSVKINGAEVTTITSTDFPAGSTGAITKTVSFPVDINTPATITIVASSVKNDPSVNGTYKFTVQLSDVRDTSNNLVTLVTDTLVGDKTTIQVPALTLKNATVAAPTNSTLANASNQEVGRFGLSAEGNTIRINNVVLTATGTYDSLSNVVNASSVELWDADLNVKLSSSVNISGNTLTFSNISQDVTKDNNKNFKVMFTSVNSLDTNYGKTLRFIVGTSSVSATTVNSSSSIVTSGAAVMKTYTIGIVPPVLLVTGNSPLTQNAKVATIRVTNQDSNIGLTLSGITLDFATRSTANGSFTFAGNICLRDLGSSDGCGVGTSTPAQVVTQAGGHYTFIINGSNLSNAANVLSKNGGYTEYEVYVDGAPLWVTGDNANVSVKSIDYTVVGGGTATQSYVSVPGSTATATK